MTRESNLKSGSVGSVGSAEFLLAIRNLYSRRPEYFHHEPWELQHVLFSLGHVDDLADEAEALLGKIEDYSRELQAQRDRQEDASRLDTFATKKGKHDKSAKPTVESR